ncbi:MAG: hypothetical protein PUP92_11375 [Rhizonema sp. PD38]|nr:hypothetical protein [Rhizonema sp. PD38]
MSSDDIAAKRLLPRKYVHGGAMQKLLQVLSDVVFGCIIESIKPAPTQRHNQIGLSNVTRANNIKE